MWCFQTGKSNNDCPRIRSQIDQLKKKLKTVKTINKNKDKILAVKSDKKKETLKRLHELRAELVVKLNQKQKRIDNLRKKESALLKGLIKRAQTTLKHKIKTCTLVPKNPDVVREIADIDKNDQKIHNDIKKHITDTKADIVTTTKERKIIEEKIKAIDNKIATTAKPPKVKPTDDTTKPPKPPHNACKRLVPKTVLTRTKTTITTITTRITRIQHIVKNMKAQIKKIEKKETKRLEDDIKRQRKRLTCLNLLKSSQRKAAEENLAKLNQARKNLQNFRKNQIKKLQDDIKTQNQIIKTNRQKLRRLHTTVRTQTKLRQEITRSVKYGKASPCIKKALKKA